MSHIFVVAFLTIGDTVLLTHRMGSSFGSGLYGMVGGKVEAGEAALPAIQREVREETLLDIPCSSFELVHTLHRHGTETEFIALCFRVDISSLESPQNNEPHKHSELRFFPATALPHNILPAHKQMIECIQKSICYSEHGW
jgi:8-oxo-dGTP diphosphatase